MVLKNALVMQQTGAGTNAVTINPAASITSYSLTLPSAQSSGTQFLQNNGSGVLSWASAGAGTVTSVSGTTNQITSTGGTTPVLAIANPLTLPGAMTAGGAIAMGANKITGLANGTASTDAAAFGQVGLYQTVQATETTGGSTSSTSFVSLGASVPITPSTTSGRIRITFNVCFNNSILGNQVVFGIGRGATPTDLVTTSNSPWRSAPAGTNDLDYISGTWVDAPATTAATTYRIRVAVSGGTASIGAAVATGTMTFITCSEIL